MRLSLTSFLLLFAGCDSCLPEDWRATHAAGVRRMEATRLGVCLETARCTVEAISPCFCTSAVNCIDAGIERECGQMEKPGPCGEALTQAVDLDDCPGAL